MTGNRLAVERLDTAIRDVCGLMNHSGQDEPSYLSEEDLWRELVACILGSRVRFEVAHDALLRLDAARLFSRERRTGDFNDYECDVTRTLAAGTGAGAPVGTGRRYPFPGLRGRQVRMAAERLYGEHTTISDVLCETVEARDVRRFLAAEIPGLGPKQASLFLRNVGFAAGLAVLDAHILSYMAWRGLTRAPVDAIRTIHEYERLESTLQAHAEAIGYPLDQFDVAIWVVVRVAKREDKAWRS